MYRLQNGCLLGPVIGPFEVSYICQNHTKNIIEVRLRYPMLFQNHTRNVEAQCNPRDRGLAAAWRKALPRAQNQDLDMSLFRDLGLKLFWFGVLN